MKNLAWFVAAAVLEIAGCYATWAWLRLGRSALWLVPGTLSLILFALVLTRVEADFAGRAFAAYGGIYIVISLLWIRVAEGGRPSEADIIGVLLCLAGAATLLWGRR